VVLLLAHVALACPVCFSSTEENRMMFIATTGLLTFLPLALVGGFLFWLRKKVKAREAASRC